MDRGGSRPCGQPGSEERHGMHVQHGVHKGVVLQESWNCPCGCSNMAWHASACTAAFQLPLTCCVCFCDAQPQVGDVLYMPRGCIHQASAQEGDSAHLTISTYQRWSFADLLQVCIISIGIVR